MPVDVVVDWFAAARRAGLPCPPARRCRSGVRPTLARAAEARTLPAALRDALDGGVPPGHPRDDRRTTDRRGSDGEGPAPPVRRGAHRVRRSCTTRRAGRCAPRAPHGVHLLPGRLRGRLPVLRHGRARASRATSRRARSSTRSGTRRGGWPPTAAGSRTSCSWAWASRCSTSIGCCRRDRAQRSAPVRARGAAHHRLHLRRRARDRAADCPRRRSSRSPSRCTRRATSLRDVLVPAQPALAGRRRRRRGAPPCPRDRPTDQLRGDADRGDQRHRRPMPTRSGRLLRADHAPTST